MQQKNQDLVRVINKKLKNKKKAMLKTVEALIAIVLTLIFIVLVFSRAPEGGIQKEDIDMLKMLHVLDEFRNCAAANNLPCINNHINDSMPKKYDFYVDMSPDPSGQPLGLPEKHIYRESLIIAGNTTHYNPNIIRLYYWIKS